MGLTMKSALGLTGREFVSVGPFRFDDAVGMRRKGEFLQQFARESFFPGLVRLDSSLRELPCTGDIQSFADQDPPVTTLDNTRHSRSVDHFEEPTRIQSEKHLIGARNGDRIKCG